MPTDLPSGLDVYAILLSALENEEYRAILLTIVGFIFAAGFTVGFCIHAIMINPKKELSKWQK